MSLFSCRICQAKDAEIARLWLLLQALMPRELASLPGNGNPESQPSLAPLAPEVDIFLDAKFVRGTPVWRQQRREAEKLAAKGVEAERIMETLARGQTVEF